MESRNTDPNRDPIFEGRGAMDRTGGMTSLQDQPQLTPASTNSKSKRASTKQDGQDKAQDAKAKVSAAADQAKDKAETGKKKVAEAADTAEDKANQLANRAEDTADTAIDKSADGLHKAADKARSATEDRDDAVGKMGTQAADALEKGATYLEDRDSEQMIQDLESLIRRRPAESLLVAAGVGFLFARAVR